MIREIANAWPAALGALAAAVIGYIAGFRDGRKEGRE